MTIKQKLYYSFAITLILFSVSVTSFFVVINNFDNFTEVKIGNSMKEAALVQMLLNKNHKLMLDINEILLRAYGMNMEHKSRTPSSIVTSITEIISHTAELGGHIKYCQVIYNKDDSEVKEFKKLESSTNEFIKGATRFVDMWQGNKSEGELFQYYLDNIHSQAEANEGLLNSQYEQSLGEVMEQQEQFKVLLADGLKIIAVIAMVIFILIFGIVHRNARSISTSLEKLKKQALAISEGNYDVQIKVTSKDEIGELAEAFNYMAATISKEMEGRKLAEDAQRRSQKMDAIGQLTGGIAHDFNNILGIILGNLEMLKRQMPADDKVINRIKSMKQAGQRAADLTKQLLSISRRQVTQLTVIDIKQLIGEMESLIAHSLTPEVEVEYQFTDNLWLTELDPGDFKDALLNLSINARDAIAGHGHLTIDTRNVTLDADYCAQNTDAKPGQYIQLSVTDSGAGIPAELQEQIFEPFFTTKEQGKGTGLGLAMVYGFVKRSGGYIDVSSEYGSGTTFNIYLPRYHGEKPPVDQKNENAETLPYGQETILVVDDETSLVELAQESLEGLGYRVLIASDGIQALKRLDEEPSIDLLFSDVVMPGGINGYELAEQATASLPDLKVVLTSGYTGKSTAYNGQDRFNANLLSKPYTQAELSKRVRTILDGEEMQ